MEKLSVYNNHTFSEKVCSEEFRATDDDSVEREVKIFRYDTSTLFFLFAFERVFPSRNCRTILQKILSCIALRHFRFELVDHDLARRHLMLREDGRTVDLRKHDAKEGLCKFVIVIVNGLVNMKEDEISIEVGVKCKHGDGWPVIGLTGPEGEYDALI